VPHDVGVNRTRWAYLLFAIAAVAAVVAVAGSIVVRLGGRDAFGSYLVTNVAIGVAFAPCGLLVARHRPGNPIGWLLLCAAVAPLTSAAMVPVAAFGAEHRWPEWALRLAVTVFLFAWPWGVGVCLPLALQLFPTGAPVSPRWRPLIVVTVAVGVASVAVLATGPAPDLVAESFLLLGGLPSPVYTAVEVLLLLVLLASVLSLLVRYRTGGDTVRRQLLWLLLAAVVAVGINVPGSIDVAHRSVGDIALLLTLALVPVAMTVAILRHRLFDIRLVVSRAVLYLLLTACVIGAYAALVAVLGRALRGAGAPVFATLLIALAFNPARVRLQRLADRAFYGARADPVRAVSQVGRRLAGDDLGGVVDGVREALRVPFAALRSGTGEIAASGQPPATLRTVALTYRGTRVGDLVVGVRRGEGRLSAADLAVLDLLATPLAVAVHAVGLSEQVQASRERLIGATEEERRRLHRELHDSLGPSLTGAAFKVQAAANYVRADPQRAEQLATELADDLQGMIDDVRRLVYGLRPPALDELGLVGALQRYAGQFPGLGLRVDGPDPMPLLPAAVEVAAFRIATEAVANVVRHAGARRAVVSLTPAGTYLRLTVTDDGPAGGQWQPGVGLRSIAERAAEVGGHAAAGPTPEGGRVVAVLPLAVAS
jgi:two-component system NarL family sensor kinase